MTAAQRLLDRLDGVRTRPVGWIARCPAHCDRSPSLAIRELDDGRVLVHCFAGCEVSDVLSAVDLTLADMFPKRMCNDSPQGGREARAALREIGWAAALGVLSREASIVLTVVNALARGVLTAEHAARLETAVERIQLAREVLTA
jgi:hypothetical protein